MVYYQNNSLILVRVLQTTMIISVKKHICAAGCTSDLVARKKWMLLYKKEKYMCAQQIDVVSSCNVWEQQHW